MTYPEPKLSRLVDFRPGDPFHIYWFDFEVFPEVTILCILSSTGRRTACVGAEACRRWLNAAFADPETVLVGYNCRNYDNVIAARLIAGATQAEIFHTNEVLVGNRAPCDADWLDDIEEVDVLDDAPEESHRSLEDMAEHQVTTVTRRERSVSPLDLVWRTPRILDVYKRTFDIGLNAWAPRKKGLVNIPAVSLKTWEAQNGLKRVECPIPFGTSGLTDEQVAQIVDYCHYNVAATACLSCGMAWGEFSGRIALVGQYGPRDMGGVHWGHTKAKAAAMILGAGKETKYDEACEADPLPIPWERLPLVVEKLPALHRFYSQPCSAITEQGGVVADVCGLSHQFGIGGCHSIHTKPRRIDAGENRLLHDDAASMYPAIIIELDLLPEHCTRRSAYAKAMKERLRKKKIGDPTAAADKILLNSVSGAMDQRGSALYHHRNAVLCRVYGQLCLMELALALEPFIDELIQSNTDGVYVIPTLGQERHVERVNLTVGKRVGLTFETDLHWGMFQKNINNYVVWDEPGKVKVAKGSSFATVTANKLSGIQRVELAKALGIPVPWGELTPDDFVVNVARDKNSECFELGGERVLDERLRVVAVKASAGLELFTRLKSGGTRKATGSPDSCIPVERCKLGDIDVSYYESFGDE